MSAPEAREDRDHVDDLDTDAPESAEVAADLGGVEQEDFQSKYLRAVADYQNLQRRSLESEPRIRVGGIASVARSLVPALDQFDLALAAVGDADSLRAGMQLIRSEMLKALAANGVEVEAPQVGDTFDPNLHEAVMRQAPEGDVELAAGSISMVLQPGYRLGEIVIRPAKVALAPGEED